MQITILFWLTAPFFGLGVDDFAGGYLLDHKNLKYFLLDNNEVKLEIAEDLYDKIEVCAKSKGLSVDDFLSSVLRPPG